MANNYTMIPSPAVQHLTTIFRRIQNGEIRVPAFQRSFVWESSQVIDLLESIYKGYPIGSVLFWKIDSAEKIELTTVDLRTPNELGTPIPFPYKDLQYPTNFVLDGMQRLSTLFGVFFAPEMSDKFNVLFDLQKKEFVFKSNLKSSYLFSETEYDHLLSLSDLFVPRQLIQAQQKISRLANGDELIDESITLLTAFQEYMLPIVTISSSGITEVVEIFERVNRTGSKLSRFHFMRALTWSGGFDLTEAVQGLSVSFENSHFKFTSDTLTKIIAVQLDKNPNPKSMLELRTLNSSLLQDGVEKTKRVLNLVIKFLQERCGVYSSVFVPYEGQLIILSKLFGENSSPPEEILEIVRCWFWNTSLSEALRGKPDSYVTNDIRDLLELLSGNDKALSERMLLDEGTILQRRFTRKAALSSAIVGLFSHREARSIYTGEPIHPLQYISAFNPTNVQPIVSYSAVADLVKRKINSSKVLANICVTTEQDRERAVYEPVAEALVRLRSSFDLDLANRILASQLISQEAFSALQRGDEHTFLTERAKAMRQAAHEMTATVPRPYA